MRTSAEIREGFRAFFESKGHLRHPSGSLVPATYDPSVLLTTAGMQPLKPFFLGLAQPPAPTLTTVQKCFRTTDIDEVGNTARHLTFFEMLGNFSFGDYFKHGAIGHAWEFVTEYLQLDGDLLWATVFAGDPELGLGPDEVAIARWEEVGVPPDRIVRLPRADNFWQAGPTGPCGPCSELYFDRGPTAGCGRPDCAPGCECDRFLEFWNLVFMEFELHADGTLTPLPRQNIDTGMGVERTSAILQGVHSVYETDGFQTIMRWVEQETGTAYGADEVATKAHRVLADHGRAMTFLVADGVTPGNEGRGYVLRRVIRRAVLQGNRIGLQAPFLARLADVVIAQMGSVYPELERNRTDVHAVLTLEEERFSTTLARGLRLFEERTAGVATGAVVTGDDAFLLHDTYGFPVELTQELALERGLGVDLDRFHVLMGEQRQRSRASAGEKGDQRAAEFARSAGFRTEFVGYERIEVRTQLGAVEEVGDGLFLAKLRESPFYVESGGQVTDQGWIEAADGRRAELRQAFKFEGDQALLLEGEGFAAGDRVQAVVPWATRFPTAANHTATHLLHEALRQVLGDHVKQAGSSVRPDKLRFDFTHGQALTHEQRAQVEEIVNREVFANRPVHIFETPIAEARTLGAQMLFGEKYGEIVRVVDIVGFSTELCGGTHVRSTAEIGPFAILSEGSVGSGARRIEAVTAGEAYAYLRGRSTEADELRGELERLRKELRTKASAGGAGTAASADETVARLLAGAKQAGGVTVVAADLGELDGDAVLELSDRIKSKAAPAAVALAAHSEGRVTVVVNLDGALPERGVNAGDIVKVVAPIVGGGGGGRPTMARAGGKDPSRIGEAVAAAEQAILAKLV